MVRRHCSTAIVTLRLLKMGMANPNDKLRHYTNFHFEGSGLTINAPRENLVKRNREADAVLLLNAYDKEFENLFEEVNSGQTEIIVNGSILFAVLVVVVITVLTLLYGCKECFESIIDRHREKSIKYKAIKPEKVDTPEEEVERILCDDGQFSEAWNTPAMEIYPRLKVLSDPSNPPSNSTFGYRGDQSFSDWIHKNSVPNPTSIAPRIKPKTSRGFQGDFEKMRESILTDEMVNDLDRVENGNLSSFLSKEFESEQSNTTAYFKGGRYRYSMKQLLILRSPAASSPLFEDSSLLDYKKEYTRDDILWELKKLQTLSSTIIKLKVVSKAEKYIKEIKEILMNQSFNIRPNDHTTKPLAVVRLLSMGLNCLDFNNPNVFLEEFNKLMNEIIESGAIFELFKIERVGGFLVVMIMHYIFCHWHYLDSSTQEIERIFQKWESPVLVQQKFFLFKYLITLKISGVANKTVDRFLLHLEVQSSYVPLINEAMRITEDENLLKLLYCLKRKCHMKGSEMSTGSPTTALSTFYQRSRTIPGSFSAW